MSIVHETSVKYIHGLYLCFCVTGVPPSKESLLIKRKSRASVSQRSPIDMWWIATVHWFDFWREIENGTRSAVLNFTIPVVLVHRSSISPSVDAEAVNGIHKWVRLDFCSCAEVWRCLYWCRDTGTVFNWRALPELKRLMHSNPVEKEKNT